MIQHYKNRIINIHPSLLPAFQGKDAQNQALEYGVKITGCTTHFIDEGTDTGPIILQRAINVNKNDTLHTLSNRILKEEHKILVKSIKLLCDDKVEVRGRHVIIH
jgi:phosphoribosylglycinamide formyltransferase-1